jgi:hypothetical protein
MGRIEKIILSFLCGATLGVPACYDSGDRPGGHGTPADASVDTPDDSTADVDEEEGPIDIPMYGPPIETLYGPPAF